METAIEQILLIQETYPPELVRLCLTRPARHSDGTWMPERFGNLKEIRSYRMRSIPSSKATPALIEMSSMTSTSVNNPL